MAKQRLPSHQVINNIKVFIVVNLWSQGQQFINLQTQ